MGTTRYRIAEVAERSGYSPPTLRYYEDIGLLPAPERGPNGYRLYDDSTVDRLGFITRAKQLGCSLDEIAGLARVWEAGECAPVQHGLRAAVEAKLTDAQARIAELTQLASDLHRIHAALGTHTPAGPCDAHCGCTSPSTSIEAVPVVCTLGAGDVERRVEDWRAVLVHVRERQAIAGGLRLTFGDGAPVAEVARLAAAEQGCCQFFAFVLRIDDRGVTLDVRAPATGQPVLAELFGGPG